MLFFFTVFPKCLKNAFLTRHQTMFHSLTSKTLMNQNFIPRTNVLKMRTFSSTQIDSLDEEPTQNDVLYKFLQIEARSADKAVLDSFEKFVSMAALCFEIPVDDIWEPFRTIKRRTLLRSAFVKKKYRVQYEMRTYYKSIKFKYLTGSTADTFLEYIERNLPEGVAMKIQKQKIENISSLLSPPN